MRDMQERWATILFVDDEASILASLKRLFRPFGYRILTAESGAQGLEIMACENIDLVISDMSMPGINGAQFLEKVRERWPDTIRIVLTGSAEIGATIEAINKGQIYRYVSKPWEDNDITLMVKHALQQKILEREKLRLDELTHSQNEKLKELNQTLRDEKELLEDIVMRMRSASPFVGRRVRHIQKSLERTCGDIVLSAYRPNGAQHVLVGDFSGHGLPAAFAGPLASYIFYSLTADGHDLCYILAEVNRMLCHQLPTQLYMAASALELSAERNLARVWNYGMQPVLCLSNVCDMVKVKSNGLPLGICESFIDFEPHALLDVCTDMRIYQYSDGIIEAASPEQEEFGHKRLDELVMRIFRGQLPLEIIWEELKLHCGGQELSDDAVMVETSTS